LTLEKSGVIAWSRLARRSSDIAKVLRIKIYHFADRPPYLKAWRETPRLLREIGEDACIILQLPPGPAAYRVTRSRPRPRVLCDVHTGMFYYSSFKAYLLNRPFLSFLRSCDHVLVHNPESKQYLSNKLKINNISVVYDPLPRDTETQKPSIVPEGNFVVLPVSWEPDEDIPLAVEALSGVNELSLVITGNYKKRPSMYKKILKIIRELGLNGRVLMPGYVDYSEYLWYIKNSVGVIALTNREYTILSAIWEAALYNKPIVYPLTRTLSNLLRDTDSGMLSYTLNNPVSLSRALRILTDNDKVMDMGKRMSSKLRVLSTESMKKLSSLCVYAR